MTKGLVTVRADCNAAIGYGHVMRCLAVAAALNHLDTDVCFAMGPDSDCAPVKAHGYSVISLKNNSIASEDMIAKLTPHQGPLLLDSYSVSEQKLENLRSAGFNVALFDDAMRLKHYACDLVIDSAPGAPLLPYLGLVGTRFCLGSDYFPLRQEFNHALRQGPVSKKIKTIIVTFGGSDPDDFSLRVLKALGNIEADLNIFAILGPAYVGRVNGTTQNDKRIHVMRNVSDMAALMATGDVAICGSSSTALELAYLGVPMVLLSLSPDQISVGRALNAAGAGKYLNNNGVINERDICGALQSLMDNSAKRQYMRDAGQALIDGQGAARVADAITKIGY
jgi:UDP-2,4-diacetamido-2,4,6-trideoxy-beta-L-altropyranose hydrolase